MPCPQPLVYRAAIGLLATWVAGCAAATPAPAAGRCEALQGWAAGSAQVLVAEALAPPASVDGVALSVPICRVQGVARPAPDSDIRFELWLPEPAAWRGRYKQNGTGGFAGHTPRGRMAEDVVLGFASAGSNMGHDGGESARWALNHPEKVLDWGLRAHAEVATAAKMLAQAHYGEPVRRAYFEGCSNGGRQGMVLAQRYPTLFDGIVAGAPSMFYPDMLMTLLWMGRQQVPVPGQPPVLSSAKRALLHQHVMQACDAQDGLVDGQITNPLACHVDPSALRCGPSADASTCLSDTELEVVTQMLAGPHSEAGVPRWTGPLPGSELEWAPHFADQGGYGRFIGHVVFGLDGPPFDWRELNFGADYERVKQSLTPLTAAPSPDLSAFRAHGGKLIQYHGWADAIVTPQSSPNYVNALAQFERLKGLPAAEYSQRVAALTPVDLGAVTLAQASAVQQYHRLFMLPGVGHCGGGGPDAIGGGAPEPPASYRDAQHHVLQALMHWVEDGVAPEQIVASRFDAQGQPLRQRPLCPYPQAAAYQGWGDINAAASFRCVTPAADALGATAADVMQVQNALRQRAGP